MDYVYLDYAATSPMDPEVINEIKKHFESTYGNASSLHTAGHTARTVIDDSRITIATTKDHVCAMQKGKGSLSKNELMDLIDLSFKKGNELRDILLR